jgi:hypothetical protein
MRRISWIVFFIAFIGICDAIPGKASAHFPFVERNFVISKGLPSHIPKNVSEFHPSYNVIMISEIWNANYNVFLFRPHNKTFFNSLASFTIIKHINIHLGRENVFTINQNIFYNSRSPANICYKQIYVIERTVESGIFSKIQIRSIREIHFSCLLPRRFSHGLIMPQAFFHDFGISSGNINGISRIDYGFARFPPQKGCEQTQDQRADRQEKCECSNGLPSAGRPQTLDYGHLILYSIGGLIGIAIGLLIRLWVYFYEKYFYRRGY